MIYLLHNSKIWTLMSDVNVFIYFHVAGVISLRQTKIINRAAG